MNSRILMVKHAHLELLLIRAKHQEIKNLYGENIPAELIQQMTEELKVFRMQCDKEVRRMLSYEQ